MPNLLYKQVPVYGYGYQRHTTPEQSYLREDVLTHITDAATEVFNLYKIPNLLIMDCGGVGGSTIPGHPEGSHYGLAADTNYYNEQYKYVAEFIYRLYLQWNKWNIRVSSRHYTFIKQAIEKRKDLTPATKMALLKLLQIDDKYNHVDHMHVQWMP